jgi:yersiniabactin nonribosomal peptide synthetase
MASPVELRAHLLEMLLVAPRGKGRRDLPLRQTLLSGDWIGWICPQRLQNVAPGCRLAALGGATEAAIWSNYCDVTLPLPGIGFPFPMAGPCPAGLPRGGHPGPGLPGLGAGRTVDRRVRGWQGYRGSPE